ncbi:hypothetical protein BH20CHL6_BH20CHL6_03100 [soil metagenome]
MVATSVAFVRRALGAFWALLLIGLLGLVALSHLAPITGYQPFIIRGSSMNPTIPVGSLALVAPVEPGSIQPGHVITMRMANNVVVTHRVIRVVQRDGGQLLETKGDAVESADPALVLPASVIGRAELYVPLGGYLLAFLSMPFGLVSILSLLTSLLFCIWTLEEHEEQPQSADALLHAQAT